ncbi:hypothetical protein ABVK25_010021 [Lepraria finkii]|uniref:Uncharacterized protein n=1 Tax=Lepraria finkii TaxID=1340010 RepID=A0ABR4AWM6_9LECA
MLVVSLLITALNFGSRVALNTIISLSNAALLFSYIASLGSIRITRWRGEELLPRRWSLGNWGSIINDVALAFLFLSFIFSFFPETPMPGAEGMSWAIVIFAFVIAAASLTYFVKARRTYIAPGSLIKQD